MRDQPPCVPLRDTQEQPVTSNRKYIARCRELDIDPVQSIITTLETCEEQILDLSSQTLSSKICAALGNALAEDKTFTKLIFQDAYIGDEGCIMIANALKTNMTVQVSNTSASTPVLNLRGNNIRSDGATAISQLLRINSCITSLLLEWNSIGVWDKGVLDICDALGHNGNLAELDLRNNKISSMAGQYLAISLKHNTSLQKLDLRWNHLGLIGGRAFEDLFKWNHVITHLDLAGNEVPEDQLQAIAIALERNLQQKQHSIHETSHAIHLSETIDAIAKAHEEALRQLTSKLTHVENKSRTLSEELDRKVAQHISTESTVAKLNEDIALLNSQCKAIEETQFRERSENRSHIEDLERSISGLQVELKNAKEEKARMQTDMTTRVLQSEATIKSLEVSQETARREKMMLLADIASAEEREQRLAIKIEETIRKTEASFNKKIRHLEDIVSEEQTRNQQLRASNEGDRSRYEQDLQALRDKLADQIHTLEDHHATTESRIRHTEATRRESLEREIESLRSQLANLQDTHSAIKQKLVDKETEVTSTMHAMKVMESEVYSCKSSISRYENEIEGLRKQVADALNKNLEMSKELKSTTERVKHAENGLKTTEEKYQEVKVVLEKKVALLNQIEQDEKARWQTLQTVFRPHHYT
ncbi:hypothetical protein SeLEV6574_g04331 [Synchytrium endobioticum]|uniref:Uncharacterized protein n=1 Tax=Synchytrium endobioticum TaxID=286115 RepID=A0A507CZP9_9FUNG|nr:hypothetical protein SeLEV6574_g04331 [Synchytrium endobioticum]